MTEFGRWLLTCEKCRGNVAVIGDVPLADYEGIGDVARSIRATAATGFETLPMHLDLLVSGSGADILRASKHLVRDGLILGVGLGPMWTGWRKQVIQTPDGVFFRMGRE